MPILGVIGLLILGIIVSIIEAIFKAICKASQLESDEENVQESLDYGESYASDSIEEEFERTKEREEFERDKEWEAYYRERTDAWEAEQSPICPSCRTFYVELGIPAEAMQAEIKQRYRDLCTFWHPDRFEYNAKMKDRATREFQEIQQAFNHVSAHVRARS
jgi:curved DNA-binding protein CbpA